MSFLSVNEFQALVSDLGVAASVDVVVGFGLRTGYMSPCLTRQLQSARESLPHPSHVRLEVSFKWLVRLLFKNAAFWKSAQPPPLLFSTL